MGWESLPPDLCHVISAQIPIHADYIRFRAVCATWRHSTSPNPSHLPRQLPFLLLPNKCPFTFTSPSENNREYLIPYCGPTCQPLGSSHGWLFLMGSNTNLFLLNPFKRTMIDLPSVVEIPNLFDLVSPGDVAQYRASMDRVGERSTVGFWKYLIRKGKLCWDKGSNSGFWVAIAFPKSGLALFRPGDKTWSHTGRYWQFADAELYKGQLYTVTRGGILSTLDISNNSPFQETVLVSSPPFTHEMDISIYLLVSNLNSSKNEDLLLVVRKFSEKKTSGFEVFKLEDLGWTRVGTLLDECIVLSKGGSVCVKVESLEGFKENCVFYSEDFEEGDYEGFVGCYELESGEIKRVNGFELDKKTGWNGPVWVTPCLW